MSAVGTMEIPVVSSVRWRDLIEDREVGVHAVLKRLNLQGRLDPGVLFDHAVKVFFGQL